MLVYREGRKTMKLPRAAVNLTLYPLYSFFIPWRNVPSSLAFKTLAWSHVYVFRTFVLVSCTCVLTSLSRVWLFVALWTVAWQAPLSMGFSRQEYWSGLSCPSPRDLPDPGIQLVSPAAPALQADSLLPPGKPLLVFYSRTYLRLCLDQCLFSVIQP